MRVGLAARYAAFVTSHPLRAVGKFLRVGARNLLHWIGSPALAPCRSYLEPRCAHGRSNRARIATCESFPRLLQRLDAVRQLQLGDALGDVAQLDAPQLAVVDAARALVLDPEHWAFVCAGPGKRVLGLASAPSGRSARSAARCRGWTHSSCVRRGHYRMAPGADRRVDDHRPAEAVAGVDFAIADGHVRAHVGSSLFGIAPGEADLSCFCQIGSRGALQF